MMLLEGLDGQGWKSSARDESREKLDKDDGAGGHNSRTGPLNQRRPALAGRMGGDEPRPLAPQL